MSCNHFDLSALAAAAKANDCTVHLHQDADGRNVFSVGNSNIGAREFVSFDDAMTFATKGESRKASAATYVHPENAGVTFDPAKLALLCWNDAKSLTVPIGPLKLIEFGRALVQAGKELEGHLHD